VDSCDNAHNVQVPTTDTKSESNVVNKVIHLALLLKKILVLVEYVAAYEPISTSLASEANALTAWSGRCQIQEHHVTIEE
jgi:hypothetical protein